MKFIRILGAIQFLLFLVFFGLFQDSSASKIIKNSTGDQLNRPMTETIVRIRKGENQLPGSSADFDNRFPGEQLNYFDRGNLEIRLVNYGFPSPPFAACCSKLSDEHFNQSHNSTNINDNQLLEFYQPGNEFFIGLNLSLSNMQPSPMLKIKLANNLYRKKHIFDKGWHHLYTGIICYALGMKTKNKWAKTVGGIIITDDLVQHAFRVQSPLHVLNDNLWQHSWYRQPSKFMDKLMGKQ